MQTIATEFAFEALVSIGRPMEMGETATGKRRVIPITGEGGPPYVRTTPSFDAPQGPQGWLSRNTFVGTIGRKAQRRCGSRSIG